MSTSSTFTKGALAAVAGVMALSAAATVQAQPYSNGYAGNSYYDPCRRDEGNRGITGAVIGGAGGAVLGSQFAANGHRRDGSLLGGIVGALAGAAVGKNTTGCSGGQSYVQPRASYGSGYSGYGGAGYGYNSGYDSYGYAPPPAPYGYGQPAPRYSSRYERSDDYAYGRRGERMRVAQRADADGCSLAESPILMPDGRTQTRFVRVCMDRNGRYQVVD